MVEGRTHGKHPEQYCKNERRNVRYTLWCVRLVNLSYPHLAMRWDYHTNRRLKQSYGEFSDFTSSLEILLWVYKLDFRGGKRFIIAFGISQ